ncbi:hypothetical protein [Mycobacteroides abscessus]|uniref:Terminase small subunit n=1 Tax=Mycobacteroides abscessus subsp. bolletii 50594 TaxID=1303024 RepID=A0AB33A944_9MYCO|nr:hypothetical protein [Mycobacteroides abscessus]OHU67404.1 hypothetical protein BKG87_22175 [Mycobacteroides chelonae]AGM28184.1 hypothetical protein MASS_1582 [Mycobacteroides abscessus subsp. bolletii 50594]AMU20871.1 hypothetical protein A3N95_08670 [Mycobacteroides abscessus]MBL3752360.1 hypothetical protein [Mycobacteroides abscessus subsp. massiliense]MDO3146440.1 hypothetical protein [Mycobacteroides abscessus subsp. abscessus]
MPVAGRKAKPAGQAVNRHKPTHDWTEVLNVPFEGGQDLPDFRADGRRWPDRTKQKWNAWRAMPHCKLWGPAEWDFALDSIELAALVHEGETRHATELRNREKVLGTTLDYLRDLRIRYIEAPTTVGDSDAGVTNIADYRDL